MKADLEGSFAKYVANGEMALSVAYTDNEEEAKKFREELKTAFPKVPVRFCDPLSLSVSCHIAPGALAVACSRILK